MDNSLKTLCTALRKLFKRLQAQNQPLSFVLLTGKKHEGKTSLLKQSQLQELHEELEYQAHIFYNKRGVILELGEDWLSHSEQLLSNTIKELNLCHSSVKISGILLCVDAGELLQIEPSHMLEHCKSHLKLLQRFGVALNYRISLGLIFNKLDALAGFCEFFQTEHEQELLKPLGFSLNHSGSRQQFTAQFKQQFDAMLESLGQQIIAKLHPARSTVKRTLIREFPLQLASLRIPIQAIVQNIPAKFFKLQVLYFTSAEQGGVSIDSLNQKIQHEYALIVQDKFPQSNNYRSFFIAGAIRAFQNLTRYQQPRLSFQYKSIATAALGSVAVLFCGLLYHHVHTARQLDETSRELINYETLVQQKDGTNSSQLALYHLSKAEAQLDLITSSIFSNHSIAALKNQVHQDTKKQLHQEFLPGVLNHLQEVILNPTETPYQRYRALKVYIMLGEPKHYVENEVIAWFCEYWQKKNPGKPYTQELRLLKKSLQQPLQAIAINQQLVQDGRNYLNALPTSYLYYSLAKPHFPKDTRPIKIEGFHLAYQNIPIYFTKAGYKTIVQALPKISQTLMQENWVLARETQNEEPTQILQEAYATEYVAWWKNLMRRTQAQHYQNYQQASKLVQLLEKKQSIANLVRLIQQATSPETGAAAKLFNQKIASQFTSINLLPISALKDLNQTLAELERFFNTLSLVNDQGKTVFELTRARFINENAVDPLSRLYQHTKQLPEPVSLWTKQVADDAWFMFITETKDYLNQEWQTQVYNDYAASIAHRFPFDTNEKKEISVADFERFFNPYGTFTQFMNHYLKPFMDTSNPEWQSKELNGYVIPISDQLMNEFIRANIITRMFFPQQTPNSKIEFSLQKVELDPVVASLQLHIGETKLTDTQNSASYAAFSWPQSDASLTLRAIDGQHYSLKETGPWAFFKLLQKVNVIVDPNDSASLQILFEVNGNSGRYLLKTQNQINPFSPGVLAGFNLSQVLA